MKITLAPDRSAPVTLARPHRRVLAELVAQAVAGVAYPAHFDEESEPSPCIEGRPEYEPAPFHAWGFVPFAGAWSLEWCVPAIDIAWGAVDAVDHVAFARVGWNCADATESLDHHAASEWEYDAYDATEGVEVLDDDDAAHAVHPEFRVVVRAAEVEIESGFGDPERPEELVPELEVVLMQLVHELTGFRIAAVSDDYDEVALRDVMRLEAACRECWPESHDADAPRVGESARGFLDLLVERGAVVLAVRDGDRAVPLAAVARALGEPAGAPLDRARRLADALVACPAVDELFADDATLAAWLDAW